MHSPDRRRFSPPCSLYFILGCCKQVGLTNHFPYIRPYTLDFFYHWYKRRATLHNALCTVTFFTCFVHLDVFFLLFTGLRFPHGVRPRQLLCWRRPRWFSTSVDLWLFSLVTEAIVLFTSPSFLSTGSAEGAVMQLIHSFACVPNERHYKRSRSHWKRKINFQRF